MKLTKDIINNYNYDTPFLLLDLEKIKDNYRRLKKSVTNLQVFYAVKANSDMTILKTLVELGSSFDIASINELDKVLECGGDCSKISFGNTIKKAKDIEYAYTKGVRIFVTDEFIDMYNIAKYAPNSKVFVRIQMSDSDSDWPLTKKFGTNMEKAQDILIESKKRGLIPYGVSFHVGSQCYDKYIWSSALLKVNYIFKHLKELEIKLKFINTGGGAPIRHLREIPEVEDIGEVIESTLKDYFPNDNDLIIAAEPGRSLVGDAGIIVATVVLRSEKEKNEWIYLDTGVFHGLMETIQDFRYEILIPNRTGEEQLFTLSGPSCDSVDTMYDEIYLPNDIQVGDKVYIINTGAYTTGYASWFNGIEPPKLYIL